jgi:hypothetical protein
MLSELAFYPAIFISTLIILNCHWSQWFSPFIILFITRAAMFGMSAGLQMPSVAATGNTTPTAWLRFTLRPMQQLLTHSVVGPGE